MALPTGTLRRVGNRKTRRMLTIVARVALDLGRYGREPHPATVFGGQAETGEPRAWLQEPFTFRYKIC
jgi:hypothetical protein